MNFGAASGNYRLGSSFLYLQISVNNSFHVAVMNSRDNLIKEVLKGGGGVIDEKIMIKRT